MKIAKLMMLMALVCLTACDRVTRRDFRRERQTGLYRSAMADYKAGRLKQAIDGFRKVCQSDPANASARFQLACLLQDNGRDYLGAMCAFQEYLLQQPGSDKAKNARERAEKCELEVAKVLAERHGLTKNGALLQEMDGLRKRLKDSEKRNLKLTDDVALAMQRVSHLLKENAKLKAAIKGDAGEVDTMIAAGLKDAKALLDEDESDHMKMPGDARRVKRESDADAEEDIDRIKLSADVASLRRESDADEALAGSSLLPQHASNATRKPVVQKRPEPTKPEEPPHEKRPAEYVVQEGDTLYKIAVRFYGRSSAWKLIRNANKAVISTDGRVKTGMKIDLPDPE